MKGLPVVVTSLVCSRDVETAVACLGSLVARSLDAVGIRILDDGSLGERDHARLQEGLTGVAILRRAKLDERMDTLLRLRPATLAYRRRHPLALKLLDAVELAGAGRLVYCDSDVLFFRPFTGLATCLDRDRAIFTTDRRHCYSISASELWRDGRLKLPARVNTGLFAIRREIHDPDFIEWFLGHPRCRHTHWTEQTCWALLGHRSGCRRWPESQVSVMREGQSTDRPLIAGHFTKTVRGLLRWHLHSPRQIEAHAALALNTVSAGRCRVSNLYWNNVKRWCATTKYLTGNRAG